MRQAIAGAAIQHGIRFQALNISGHLSLRRFSPAPTAFNACACSVAFNCPDPFWSNEQFQCQYGNNCTADSAGSNWPVLIKSCTTTASILAFDFRCFFNQACIDALLSMFNVDLPTRLPLPAATRAISALNKSKLSFFSPNHTFEKLLGRYFIDKWEMLPDFAGYYNTCSPIKCTYTITRKMDYLYVVTNVFGLLGGIVIILRLLVPVGVTLIHLIASRWYPSYRNADGTPIEKDQGENQVQVLGSC
jgi:hypothetical protein